MASVSVLGATGPKSIPRLPTCQWIKLLGGQRIPEYTHCTIRATVIEAVKKECTYIQIYKHTRPGQAAHLLGYNCGFYRPLGLEFVPETIERCS